MKRRLVGLGLLLQSLVLAASGEAEDLPDLKASRARALATGLGEKPLASFQRAAGPGRDSTQKDLVQRLAGVPTTQSARIIQPGDAVVTVEADSTTVRSLAGWGWSLQIRGDGTAAAFHDDDAATSKRSLGLPKDERLKAERLVALGQTFRASVLGNQIRLGVGERLVPLATRYQVEDGASRRDALSTSREVLEPRVIANRILFGREIDGVPVLGQGSWLSVTFANDGTLIGFEYDWPQYTPTGQKQVPLTLDNVLVRAAERSQLPLGAAGVTIENMDCGFFDAGTPGERIQPACVISYHERGSGGDVASFSDPIPAAVAFVENAAWPESAPKGRRGPLTAAEKSAFLTAIHQRLANASDRVQ